MLTICCKCIKSQETFIQKSFCVIIRNKYSANAKYFSGIGKHQLPQKFCTVYCTSTLCLAFIISYIFMYKQDQGFLETDGTGHLQSHYNINILVNFILHYYSSSRKIFIGNPSQQANFRTCLVTCYNYKSTAIFMYRCDHALIFAVLSILLVFWTFLRCFNDLCQMLIASKNIITNYKNRISDTVVFLCTFSFTFSYVSLLIYFSPFPSFSFLLLFFYFFSLLMKMRQEY